MSTRRTALWVLLAAKAFAGIGVGWDIRWHIVIGRDSFWIAPHVMTYAGVAVAALVSFGVLAWETYRARDGRAPAATLRVAGLVGTRGWHLAWWGMSLTILAAPIDDLWHRMFGIDVTLWSPPHLLGLAGAQINGLACLLIAHESWPARTRARLIALLVGGTLLFSGFQTGIDPGVRTAFLNGGLWYFTWAALGALFLTFTLLLAARLAGSRALPVAIAIGGVLLQLAVIGLGDLGFAILQPASVVAEVVAADPTSPIGVAHEIARRNGNTPGRAFGIRTFPVLPALVMLLFDPRRRPVAAGLAFGLALYVVNGVMFLRAPAMSHVRPEGIDALVAVVVTAAVALVATALALAFERRAGAA
ncbi:MAG: hypothetical protein FJ027_07040, partial [Candidatus Rokubacteria bacterium]|nr:hypothetical protein [Candidatus Rokubacteria bacterium]